MIQMLQPMSLKARELDPTRLILDESGGWAKGQDVFALRKNRKSV